MVNRKHAACLCLSSLLSGVLISAPARADDAKTGFFAGLGFSAADGKTSLGAGAGTIEAALLISDAFLMAGAEVRRLTEVAAQKQHRDSVLLLSHSDTLDLSMARVVAERLESLNQSLPPDSACKVPPVKPDVTTVTTKSGSKRTLSTAPDTGSDDKATPTTTETKKGFQRADIAPALATSISISGITLSADDRMLINAVQIGASKPTWRLLNQADDVVPTPGKVTVGDVTFLLPGEIVDFAEEKPGMPGNGVISTYQALKAWSAKNSTCDSPAFKAALDTIDAYDKSIVASDKGPAPLAVAAELAPLARKNPLTLRLAVEQVGGSAVARSNIWYAAGLPGAATVSAGLLVSFRLSDPIAGTDYLTGFIRCTVPLTGLREVNHRLDPNNDDNRAKATARIRCGVIKSP